MNPETALELSLLALCGVIAVEWLVLQALLGEVRRHRNYANAASIQTADRREAHLGGKVPAFTAELYPTGATLTTADLPGTSHMLLFLSIADVGAATASSIEALMYYLLSKVDGCLYIVVSGEHRDARWLDERFNLTATFGERLQLVLDQNQQLATAFAVNTTPSAALIDAGGFIRKVGWPQQPMSKEAIAPLHAGVRAAQAG